MAKEETGLGAGETTEITPGPWLGRGAGRGPRLRTAEAQHALPASLLRAPTGTGCLSPRSRPRRASRVPREREPTGRHAGHPGVLPDTAPLLLSTHRPAPKPTARAPARDLQTDVRASLPPVSRLPHGLPRPQLASLVPAGGMATGWALVPTLPRPFKEQ